MGGRGRKSEWEDSREGKGMNGSKEEGEGRKKRKWVWRGGIRKKEEKGRGRVGKEQGEGGKGGVIELTSSCLVIS